jgi:hypothetical protein
VRAPARIPYGGSVAIASYVWGVAVVATSTNKIHRPCRCLYLGDSSGWCDSADTCTRTANIGQKRAGSSLLLQAVMEFVSKICTVRKAGTKFRGISRTQEPGGRRQEAAGKNDATACAERLLTCCRCNCTRPHCHTNRYYRRTLGQFTAGPCTCTPTSSGTFVPSSEQNHLYSHHQRHVRAQ